MGYERHAISRWLAQSQISPVTGQRLVHTTFAPNHSVRTLLRSLADLASDGPNDIQKPDLDVSCTGHRGDVVSLSDERSTLAAAEDRAWARRRQPRELASFCDTAQIELPDPTPRSLLTAFAAASNGNASEEIPSMSAATASPCQREVFKPLARVALAASPCGTVVQSNRSYDLMVASAASPCRQWASGAVSANSGHMQPRPLTFCTDSHRDLDSLDASPSSCTPNKVLVRAPGQTTLRQFDSPTRARSAWPKTSKAGQSISSQPAQNHGYAQHAEPMPASGSGHGGCSSSASASVSCFSNSRSKAGAGSTATASANAPAGPQSRQAALTVVTEDLDDVPGSGTRWPVGGRLAYADSQRLGRGDSDSATIATQSRRQRWAIASADSRPWRQGTPITPNSPRPPLTPKSATPRSVTPRAMTPSSAMQRANTPRSATSAAKPRRLSK